MVLVSLLWFILVLKSGVEVLVFYENSTCIFNLITLELIYFLIISFLENYTNCTYKKTKFNVWIEILNWNSVCKKIGKIYSMVFFLNSSLIFSKIFWLSNKKIRVILKDKLSTWIKAIMYHLKQEKPSILTILERFLCQNQQNNFDKILRELSRFL